MIRSNTENWGWTNMKRMKKAALMSLRYIAVRTDDMRLYTWAEKKLFDMRSINLMPDGYYCLLYRFCMSLVEERKFLKLADWLIHRIPYNVRCTIA
ncbi:uncharacterized protein Dvar_54540 [Desulfosarcina variabilis str. Montpellier]